MLVDHDAAEPEPPVRDREAPATGWHVPAADQPLRAHLARVVDHSPRDALDPARVQVVLLHEPLDAAHRVALAQAEERGQLLLRLVVQAIVLATLAVQLVAHAPHELERVEQLRFLFGVDEALHP
jgi:hypothetical protein